MKTPCVMKLRLGTLLLLLLAVAIPARAVNPAPFISQPLFPPALAPGGPAFVLTVNGTGFVAGSVVSWNGTPLTTTFVNSDELQAAVPGADIASPGTASVTVSSGGVSSNVVYFEITSPTTSVSFSNTFYAVGAGPISVAVGDFNGDGKPDLVVVNQGSNTVSVLLGNGEGTFQPAVDYAVGTSPYSVAVGDFNGDGKLDLAVADGGNDNVGVLLGNGDGTFQPAVNYAVGTFPVSVAVGDFNGEGKLDLVVANENSNNVSVLLGNGNGTFNGAVTYAVGASPVSVAVGDFNGDGKLDLAVADYSDNNVSVLLGNGDGTFQAQKTYAVGTNPYSVAVGDFNSDGKLDLVVANFWSTNVSVLLGNDDGTFQSAVNYSVNGGPKSVVVGDLNGDGNLDLAAAIWNGIEVGLLGNGDGTFQSAVNYAAGTNPFSVAAGDFNGDGRMDLAVANFSSNNVSILLQPTPPAPPGGGTITGVTAGAGLSGGGGSGDVTLSNTGVLSVAAGSGISSTGGQNPSLSLNTAVTDLRYLQLTGGTLTGGLAAPFFTGSGAGLTSLTPASLSAGLAGISITGNAATATAAGNAAALGGVPPSGYAPASGSANYIQNNSGPAQSASLNISGSVTIGTSGTAIKEHISILENPNFPAIKSGVCASANFTLTGAADGDTIALGIPNARMTGGGILIYTAWVSASNQVTVQACNLGPSQKTAGTGSFRIDLWKQ